MKPYKMTVSVQLSDVAANDWNETKHVNFSITENIPAGADPVKYLRSRLSEEVKRHCAQVEFDWKADDVEYDDLESGDSVPIPPPPF